MSGPEQIMSVLLDAEDMRLIHRGWPQDMRLGVCLMPSGDCQLMLFHKDESTGFPERLKDHFGLRASEISIHPKVSGFATHPLKYSEERALASILSESKDLAEEAQDYSVNFSFAREEGLDPIDFMGRSVKDEAPDLEMDAPEGGLQFSSRRGKELKVVAKKPLRNLHFDLAREAARNEEDFAVAPVAPKKDAMATVPAGGFTSAAQLTAIDTAPKDFQLSKTAAGGLEIVAKTGLGSTLMVSDAQDVFLRDDRQLLALRAKSEALPERISVLPHAVPSALLNALQSGQEAVEVFAQDGYVYVTIGQGDAAATEEAVAAVTPKNRRKLWAAVRLVALLTVTVAGIYLVLGGPLGTVANTEDGQIDWDKFRTSFQADKLG